MSVYEKINGTEYAIIWWFKSGLQEKMPYGGFAGSLSPFNDYRINGLQVPNIPYFLTEEATFGTGYCKGLEQYIFMGNSLTFLPISFRKRITGTGNEYGDHKPQREMMIFMLPCSFFDGRLQVGEYPVVLRVRGYQSDILYDDLKAWASFVKNNADTDYRFCAMTVKVINYEMKFQNGKGKYTTVYPIVLHEVTKAQLKNREVTDDDLKNKIIDLHYQAENWSKNISF